MGKLKNNKALAEMLQGRHRSQTKTTVFVGGASEPVKSHREVGEVWYVTNPTTKAVTRWEQKQGYQIKQSVASFELEKLLDPKVVFKNCYEDCNKKSYTPVDKKLGIRTGRCLDCTAKYETKLRYEGKFEQYALEKMKSNAESFFKQADAEVEEIAKSMEEGATFVNVDGREEKWEGKDATKVREEYVKFKQKTLQAYGNN